jgi:tetratricopeptide (TPR) repeat protein
MIGLLGIFGVCLNNIKNSSRFRINGMIFVVIIILLSIRTFIRNSNWYDGLSLYSNDIQYKANDRLENWLALELVNAKRYDEASSHFESILKRNPKEPALYVNLASTYESAGKLQQAVDLYKDGLPVDDSGAVYYAFARFLFLMGKFAESNAISEAGVTKFPQNGPLWLIQAMADYKLGNKKDALENAQTAKNIIPNPTTEKLYNKIVNDLPLEN